MAVLANANFTSELVGLNETRKAVENAEHRARLEQRKTDSRIGRKNNREYAEALHTEADELYRKGDYESALVLYHRAANLFPRDSSHSVAARRTSATISSCNNPSKALRKAFRATNNGERLTMSLCPETAAVLANDRLKKSPNPSSVARILSTGQTRSSSVQRVPPGAFSQKHRRRGSGLSIFRYLGKGAPEFRAPGRGRQVLGVLVQGFEGTDSRRLDQARDRTMLLGDWKVQTGDGHGRQVRGGCCEGEVEEVAALWEATFSLAKQGTFVDALEELQVAAKITEEEGDTPMLSYIRNLIDQMARALRSVPLEDDCSKQRISREQIDQQQPRRSSLFVSREQTVITTMFTQRMITEYRDGFNSDASVDLDEHTDEITMHSEKTNSERSYQESPDANETVSGGGTTFRKHSRRASRCSSTSNDKFEEEEEEEEDVEEETESSGTEDDQDEGVKCASSKTSFKSANTTATYVIEGGDSKVDNGEQKGVSRMVDNAAEGSGSDKNLENSIHGDGYLHVMDQLGKMEDTELLMLLKKKLLEEDWSDFRNSGDRQECRTPRSRQDTNKVVGNH
ncbi:uncharacterized protein LOC100879090 isoform X2 [Megachile rotundata]|uniref:uncharacterized protein LOC100879090 isoform X2 n=1 Tax=Megachile rotundata TaxID=143995 RepID=UPI003FD279A6